MLGRAQVSRLKETEGMAVSRRLPRSAEVWLVLEKDWRASRVDSAMHRHSVKSDASVADSGGTTSDTEFSTYLASIHTCHGEFAGPAKKAASAVDVTLQVPFGSTLVISAL